VVKLDAADQSFFAEGAGVMSPAGSRWFGIHRSYASRAPLPVTVSIRGIDAAVSYAGAAPGYVSGLLQVNVAVPTSIDFGSLVPLMLNLGTFNSQPDITIALK